MDMVKQRVCAFILSISLLLIPAGCERQLWTDGADGMMPAVLPVVLPVVLPTDALVVVPTEISNAVEDTIKATAAHPERVTTLGEYESLSIIDETISFDYAQFTGNAAYKIQNSSNAPVSAQFAFTYTGNLYYPELCEVLFGGATIRHGIYVGWADEQDRFDSKLPVEGAQGVLYTIKVTRAPEQAGQMAKVYIGADFIVDVSRTRIVADGFGYAANPYGAVRIWSLSDGFDIGLERRLFVIGNDIALGVKAYEDEELTLETEQVDIDITRQAFSIREYLSMFSAPQAISSHGKAPDSLYAAIYEDSIYRLYSEALSDLLEIHYFLPRGEIYTRAETQRTNAIIFEITISAEATNSLEITYPIGIASN